MSRPLSDESVFRAVAHPARRKMLDLLQAGDRSVREIIDQFAMNRQTVSHHLRILRSSGLIKLRRKGRQLIYSVAAAQLRDIHKWTLLYQSHWASRAPAR